jgi:GTPase SAR1 family protein
MEFSSFVQLCQEAPNQTLLNLEKGNVEEIIAEMHMIGATDSSHLINYVNTRFKFKNSRAPLHVVSAFSGQSHLDLAALLIQNNADINCQDSSGATPLHVAAAHNNTNMISVLCKREDIRLNMTDRNGLTPLHIAIQSDSLDSALLLLTAGACTTIQPPHTGTRHCQPVATPASLIINKHKSAPREWDVLNTLVNAEARFNELVCDEAVAAVVRVFQFPHHRRIWFNRLTELTGSLIHHSRSIVHSPPVLTSDVQFVDSLAACASDDLSKLRAAADAANVKLVFDTVEQLYRSKHLKLMPSQSQLQSGLKFSLETLESLSFSDFAKPPDCSKTVSAWFKDKSRLLPHHGFLEQFMSKITSKLIAAGNSTVQCLDKHIALVSRVAVKHSVLRKVSLAASLMPCLESLAFHHVKFVSDTDGQQTYDWFPILLQTLTTCRSLHGDTSHQEVPFSVQKLSVNNCKLSPSMLYASMTLPDGITELDFSCNPDLAMSGASYILSALPQNQFFSNHQRMRRICFSRCTSRSSARDVGDCHVFKFAENLGKFSSLEHFDISFNFFDASHFSCILSHVPKSVAQLHLSGIELFDDFNEFATAVNNCLRSNGPTLSTLMLSHSPTMVQPPPSVSCCGMLSYLDISFCRNLKCIPSEVFLPSLEVLIASNNPSLEEISLQPGRKLSLSLLNLSSCSALQTLPDELYAPSLEVLLLACNISLKNIAKTGCEIVNAVNLKRIDLSQCEQLTSLPDQLASKNLVNLENILISGCTNMLYPPYKAMKTTQHIKDYLNAAKDQLPLKRVKVVLLGNGRSGKTSLLGSLKKLELDADCPSTKGVQVCPQDESDNLQSQRKLKSFAQFVGAGISNLAPEVTYWDFAGQLEYSATHDFFMSSRQAVYIIVFSVVEPPSSQADQVRYWLNTILERYSKHIRIIIVGTKIDLLDTQLKKDGFQDLNQFRKVALKRSEILMRQLVDSMTCNYNLSFAIPILFSTADKKQCYSLWKEKREALKRQIKHFSRDIFIGCDGELRFPAVHKELFHEVQELALCNPHKPVISLDDKCITAKFKLLHALRGRPDGRSLQSLDVLSDVGLLVHYKCGGQVYICPTPQYVADIVSLLAGMCTSLLPARLLL